MSAPQASASNVRKILMEYLEETVYVEDIPALVAGVQRALEALLQPQKIAIVLQWEKELFLLCISEQAAVSFLPMSRINGAISAALQDGHPLWLQEETQWCAGAAIPLVSGKLCWGCVHMEGLAAPGTQAQRAMAEKICSYLSLQLLPLLEQYNARVTALSLLKEDALIMLSSELKAPLTVASAATQQLQQKLKLYDETLYQKDYEEFFGYLQQNLYKTMRLADNLLETGRLECGYAVPQPEWFDPEEMARELVHSAQPYAAQENICLRFVSVLKEPLEICSDSDYAGRILLNLLANAMAAAAQAECGPTVSVTLARHNDTVALSVRDNGPGLSEQERAHAFEKLWQGTGLQAQRPHGAGLGLYLSQRLAQTLEATLSADECPQGACFTLRLPVSSKIFTVRPAVSAHTAQYQTQAWRQRVAVELANFMPSRDKCEK